ncbi:MAG: FlgD immunoglobulin-like domain containing protein [Candidatus Eisenbacteria bacterium]
MSRIVGNLVAQCGTGVRGPVPAGAGTIECNDVWGSAVIDWADLTDPAGTGGNFSANPLFCGGDGADGFLVDAASPCLPGNHPDGADCGTVGALGQGCDSSADAPGPGETTHGSALVVIPNPSASWIRVRGPSSSRSKLRIFDSAGRVLRELQRSSPDAAWEWDGRDATGAAVPSGAYYLRVDGALPSRILRIR